jgi:hypothetical protein
MKTRFTPAAIRALEELKAAAFINQVLRGRMVDPVPESAAYHPNWRLFQQAEWYLTCREVTHAADALNTYCQSILAEGLENTPSLWAEVKERFRKDDKREDVIKKLRVQRAPDGVVRQILGQDLGTFWNAEMDLIATLRNKIVHQGGYDPEGDIPAAIEKCRQGTTVLPPIEHLSGEIPVSVGSSGKLEIDARTAKWASDHVIHNIWMMDQNWRAHFGIPGTRRIQERVSFSGSGANKVRIFARGVPLPTAGPSLPPRPRSPILPEIPACPDMIDPKDIECAQSWIHSQQELHDFIDHYCEEIGALISELKPATPGRFPSRTVGEHEHHLGYRVSSGDPEHRGEWIGIRLRQRDKVPFLTVWSDQTLMRDFESCSLTDELQEHLRDCIAEAVSAR